VAEAIEKGRVTMPSEVSSRAMFDPVSYDAGYKEGFAEGVKHAQDFIEKSSTPNIAVTEDGLPVEYLPWPY
jgi:hypothetical protein